MPAWLQFVATILVGSGTGVLAPWLVWRYNNRDKVYSERVVIIREWRAGLHDWEKRAREVDWLPLDSEPWFVGLRRHLDDERLEEIRKTMGRTFGPWDTHDGALLVGDEINRMEAEWQLLDERPWFSGGRRR